MKNLKISIVKTAFIALSICSISIFSACNNTTEKTTNQSSGKGEVVKPPKMDIHAAAFMGDIKAIKQHILAGSDLNTKEPMGGSTPLISATTFGKTEAALLLINAEVDLDIQNNEGATALHVAAFFCRTEILKALLEKEASTSIKNNYGSTALESVQAPFEYVEEIYNGMEKALGPLGLKLDHEFLKETRPVIAEMLK